MLTGAPVWLDWWQLITARAESSQFAPGSLRVRTETELGLSPLTSHISHLSPLTSLSHHGGDPAGELEVCSAQTQSEGGEQSQSQSATEG